MTARRRAFATLRALDAGGEETATPFGDLHPLDLVANVIWAFTLDPFRPHWANAAGLRFYGAASADAIDPAAFTLDGVAMETALQALYAARPSDGVADAIVALHRQEIATRLLARLRFVRLADAAGPVALIDATPFSDATVDRVLQAAFRARSAATGGGAASALLDIGALGRWASSQLTLKATVRRLSDTNAELLRLATTDPLTGMLNRRRFLERFGAELSRARRSAQPCCVLLIDADHFKRVNDGWGHAAGDAVLRILTARFVDCVRSCDFIGRLGGEEFAICLPDADEADAAQVAERIRATVAAAPIAVDHARIPTTVSIGVAAADAHSDCDALLSAADAALYASKHAGRNRVTIAERAPKT